MNEFQIYRGIVNTVLFYMLVSALWVGVGTLEHLAAALELVEHTYAAIEGVEARTIARDRRLEEHIRWYIMRRSGKAELTKLEAME